jgi:hypothetical protein
MNTFQLNISQENEKGNLDNFYYQKFFDNHGVGKIREIIRIVNEFAPESKSFEYKPPIGLNLAVLNSMTEEAMQASKLSGSSINAELVHIFNKWLAERT